VRAPRHHRDTLRPDLAGATDGASRSDGHARQQLVDSRSGSVHMDLSVSFLAAGGSVDPHLHSFEESFFVLAGEPVLRTGADALELEPGEGGLIPVGAGHSWEAPSGDARWIEMHAPGARDRAEGRADTFGAPAPQPGPPVHFDPRDPRRRRLFRYEEGSTRHHGQGGGPTIEMLVDRSTEAELHTMFMVEFRPGGSIDLHDHPFEEAYFVLEGEVVAEAEGERLSLGAGDLLWTGVGCRHAFRNESTSPVRWLETQAPQPPARHAFRYERDWNYLERLVERPQRVEAAR
jgi:quercetin dioxygenase-like cupin family protein